MQSADFGWDTHELNFITLRESYLPWLDQSYSALMEDLEQRGMLDETLVVTLSDFGRTPNVNKSAGRDHWTYCYTVMLAGAGIRGGTVYGASDAHCRRSPRKPGQSRRHLCGPSMPVSGSTRKCSFTTAPIGPLPSPREVNPSRP